MSQHFASGIIRTGEPIDLTMLRRAVIEALARVERGEELGYDPRVLFYAAQVVGLWDENKKRIVDTVGVPVPVQEVRAS